MTRGKLGLRPQRAVNDGSDLCQTCFSPRIDRPGAAIPASSRTLCSVGASTCSPRAFMMGSVERGPRSVTVDPTLSGK